MLGRDLVKVVADRSADKVRGVVGPVTDEQLRAVAGLVVRQLLEEMTVALIDGEPVVFHGFGRFATHHRNPRTIRNPITGLPLDVPARATVGFAPADPLKRRIRGGHARDEAPEEP